MGTQTRFPLALVKRMAALPQSATITITNDDGTTETQEFDVTQLRAAQACVDKWGNKVDAWTAAFAAGGGALGFVTDRMDVAVAAAIVGALGRNYLPEDGECQSVWNALFDVLAAVAAFEVVGWVKG